MKFDCTYCSARSKPLSYSLSHDPLTPSPPHQAPRRHLQHDQQRPSHRHRQVAEALSDAGRYASEPQSGTPSQALQGRQQAVRAHAPPTLPHLRPLPPHLTRSAVQDNLQASHTAPAAMRPQQQLQPRLQVFLSAQGFEIVQRRGGITVVLTSSPSKEGVGTFQSLVR